MPTQKISFSNAEANQLSARLDTPYGIKPKAMALFAHCFTCGKSLLAIRNISKALTDSGYAVLRFDFTGLGESEGEFKDTSFSSNISDLVHAASYLSDNFLPPSLLIGHSLGGAAAIYAADAIASIQAVVTIGAPSNTVHVTHLLEDGLTDLEKYGEASVNIGGRPFKVKKQFLDDLHAKDLLEVVGRLRKPILIMHSPHDKTVGVEHAARIYEAAYHPKSFLSLDGADHLLSNKADSYYAGQTIAAWVTRYIDSRPTKEPESSGFVEANLAQDEGYTTDIQIRQHKLVADEPESLGGADLGPTPYELVSAGLASCTAITIQMYVRRKEWPLELVDVKVAYNKTHVDDCEECITHEGTQIDLFTRNILLKGDLTEEQRQRILKIANKCPVHRTLEGKNIHVKTTLIS